MGIIKQELLAEVSRLDREKTGDWKGKEAPPENTYSYHEVYHFVSLLAEWVEGKLADTIIKKGG